MKRGASDIREDPQPSKRTVLDSDGSVQIRVPLPPTLRVFSFDEAGNETHVAKPTPAEVQATLNKQVFREKEWGKAVLNKDNEQDTALDHLPEDMKEVCLSLCV